MRQRRVKNRDLITEACSEYVYMGGPAYGTKALVGVPETKPVFLEIGSGKGQFLCTMAEKHPENFYLACEGGLNINVRILQKAAEKELKNLLVITEYITVPSDYFEENSLDGIYINFCDPWPKDRHAHRRLTYRDLLRQYIKIAKPGACLEFKTDNDELFEWSLEEFASVGLVSVEQTRDLWHSEYKEKNVPTEYEEKFTSSGKTINYIKLRMK